MIRLNSPVCKAAAALLLTLTALAGCGGSDDNPNLPPEGDTTPVLGLAALQGPLTNPANGHVYFRLASADWTTSAAVAEHFFGGQLVRIDDAAENGWLLANLNSFSGSARVWLGLNDAASEGNFVYMDGSAPAYTHWEPGEPNNNGDEDYVAMYSGNGNWVDVVDVANPPGIGPVYGVVEVAAAPPVYVVDGPKLNPANGHLYYRLNSTDWTTADAFAREVMGGYLVRIADAAENAWVQANLNSFAFNGRVWLGLSDAATEGTFVYTDGSAPGYTQWEPNEPNNNGDEDYVAMYANNGNWVDVKDLANPPFIGPVYGVVEVEMPEAVTLPR